MVALVGLLAGIMLGLYFPGYIPTSMSVYVAVALLAAIDSLVGALTARLKKNFDTKIFLSGFGVNALLAVGLTFLGNILDINLYIAAVVVFGGRLFQNLAEIRRILLNIRNEK